jgi:hypothetical protein
MKESAAFFNASARGTTVFLNVGVVVNVGVADGNKVFVNVAVGAMIGSPIS